MLNDPRTYCYDYSMLLVHTATCYANDLVTKEQMIDAIKIYTEQHGYRSLYPRILVQNALKNIDNKLEVEWLLHTAALKGEERFTDLVTSADYQELG